ncbi:MAG: triphosphoribosyl-dephospho-CoA synthase, partial [Gammaproteobacteria bacterium]|nr:triphosphoribosyl-dephospho-CoA synthase [Gammaproteobacteria bacterium]
ALVYDCFLHDTNALKPGNVGRHGAGHGMDCADFLRSAEVVVPILCDRGRGLGERILASVAATRAAVGCNTNLGMILLLAPIIRVCEQHGSTAYFRRRVGAVLRALGRGESQTIFTAIRSANPGGLGRVERYDVNSLPDIDVCTAMDAAKDHDLIARQYANGYREVAHLGVNCLQKYHRKWRSVEWAVVSCYLVYLGSFPDSHIRRKHGSSIAQEVQDRAIPLFQQFVGYDNPEDARAVLLSFDRELKEAELNPGACADLTVASLLLYRLGRDCRSVETVAGSGKDR